MEPQESQIVVLPPNHTEITPREVFSDPAQGLLSWHTLFSRGKTPTNEITVGVAVCPARSGLLCRHHHPQDEVYYVLEGHATVTVGADKHQVEKGSAIYIPGGIEHGVVNDADEDFKWLYVLAV